MEFPDLGEFCSERTCNRLDFLPMKCDACSNVFCIDHFRYNQHSCTNAYQKDAQVPVCPLCNVPVPSKKGEQPDIAVGEHIDRDCQADPAVAKRKIYTNKCSVKGCKHKESVRVTCNTCNKNYCLTHRFPEDHKCAEQTPSPSQAAGAAAIARAQNSNKSKWFSRFPGYNSSSNGNSSTNNLHNSSSNKVVQPMPQVSITSAQADISEDEALALALQNSLNDAPMSQEQADMLLAQAIAESEREMGVGRRAHIRT